MLVIHMYDIFSFEVYELEFLAKHIYEAYISLMFLFNSYIFHIVDEQLRKAPITVMRVNQSF